MGSICNLFFYFLRVYTETFKMVLNNFRSKNAWILILKYLAAPDFRNIFLILFVNYYLHCIALHSIILRDQFWFWSGSRSYIFGCSVSELCDSGRGSHLTYLCVDTNRSLFEVNGAFISEEYDGWFWGCLKSVHGYLWPHSAVSSFCTSPRNCGQLLFFPGHALFR